MKTVCVYNSTNLDGYMSAAIVKYYYNIQNIYNNTTNDQINFKSEGLHTEVPILHSHNELNFIGYNYGEPVPDLEEYDKIIMCGISFPKEEMLKICIDKQLNFIWIDHHQIQDIWNYISNNRLNGEYLPEGIRNDKTASCELTWKYFFPDKTIPEIVRLLGRYECLGYKCTKEVLEFQYGARQCINNYEEAYKELEFSLRTKDNEFNIIHSIHNKGKTIYQYLCTEAKQIYKSGFEIKLITDENKIYEISGTAYTFICINKERFNPINFGIDYTKDGYEGVISFYFDGAVKLWRLSVYRDNALISCENIAKQFNIDHITDITNFTLTHQQFLQFITNRIGII